MNFWRMVAIVLALLWLLPGRHAERVMEPADDVWPKVEAMITEHSKQSTACLYPPCVSSNMLTLSHMYVRGGGFITHQEEGQPPSCDPNEPSRYFFHDRAVWHWPWWNFPTDGGAYEWDSGRVVWYTNHITFDEVKQHRHLYSGDK
jgi:hypothetical protein